MLREKLLENARLLVFQWVKNLRFPWRKKSRLLQRENDNKFKYSKPGTPFN